MRGQNIVEDIGEIFADIEESGEMNKRSESGNGKVKKGSEAESGEMKRDPKWRAET